MHLTELADVKVQHDIRGITADSRQVRPGFLFAALPGSKVDGQNYIGDAIRHGAVAVLTPKKPRLPKDVSAKNVAFIVDDNPRKKFAHMAAQYYGLQPETIVAVTGTSGKTSVVSFCQQLWHLSGTKACASLGTLGVRGPGVVRYGSLTTQPAEKLHAELADLTASGITHLAMEASSHGLDQYRLDGVRVNAAAFTNLSRDHLDYHPDMESYFKVKSRLFTDILRPGGVAVLNADDERFESLKSLCEEAGHPVVSYGVKGTDLILKTRHAKPHGQEIEITVQGKDYTLTLPLVGDFQVMNALCALALTNVDPMLLESLRGVPGRLQLVPGHPKGAAVYVDYAHKPGALEKVLETLRPHTQGKLYCVVGCGGDRDPGKRPMMGKIAAELSDVPVITDDNPRTEDPALIRKAMLEAAPKAKEIGDRREAIAWAIGQLQEGDVLVIAGKGHEQGQIIGDESHHFDDIEEAQNAIGGLA